MTRQFEVPTEHQSYLDLKVQGSPPATPASGYLRVYGNADKTVHAIDDTGNDPTGSGGGSAVVVAHGSMGASETFDYAAGDFHSGTYTADCAITLTGWPASGTVGLLTLIIDIDGTGGYAAPSWGAEVVNAADLAGVWNSTAGARNVVVLLTDDAGTTVYIVNLPAVGITADAVAALGFVGPILLADGHAVPFTFDDLLQMDDGSSFVYADL